MGVTVSTPGFDPLACVSQHCSLLSHCVRRQLPRFPTTNAAFPALGGGTSTVLILL